MGKQHEGIVPGFIHEESWSIQGIAEVLWEFEEGWGFSSAEALDRFREAPFRYPIQFGFWINLYEVWLEDTGDKMVRLDGSTASHGALWARTPVPA